MQSNTKIIEVVFWFGICVTFLYMLFCFGFSLGSIGNVVGKADDTPFKIFLESRGFNLFGDFVAGFFAPLAFVGLAGAIVLQRAQLNLANKQNNAHETRQRNQAIAEANAARLNYAATQVNYRLGLYDKRKAAFDRITRLSANFKFAIDDDHLNELKAAIFDARFVFPDEVNDWLQSLLRMAEWVKLHGINVPLLEKMRKEHPENWTDNLSDSFIKSSTELIRLQQEFSKELLSEALFKRFQPYMRLPSKIEYEKVKSIESILEHD